MTAISHFDAPKPKRRAKAFALALLPLALALTACGGGSSDPTPDPKPEDPKPEDPKPEDPKPEDPKPKDTSSNNRDADPNQSPYKDYFDFMRDVANSKVDIYKVTKSNGWSFYNIVNADKLIKLKKIYNNKGKTGVPQFSAEEEKQYLALNELVQATVGGKYTSALSMSNTFNFNENLYEPHISDTDAIDHNYVYGSKSSAVSSASEAEQETIFDQFTEAYGGNFGNLNIRSLKHGGDFLDYTNTLVALNNKAQLSFYHTTVPSADKPLSVGLDAIHMPHVSLFLYYYAETDSPVKGVKETYMSRDDFTQALEKNGKPDTWVISGLVDGTSTQLGSARGDRIYYADIPDTGDILTYKGYMLAGTFDEVAGTQTGISTYMGDVTAFLNPDGQDTSKLDIAFTNILPMKKFLAGEKSSNTIVAKDLLLFGEPIGDPAKTTPNAGNPTWFTDKSSGEGSNENVTIRGTFHGRPGDFDNTRQYYVGPAEDVTISNNYGFRDAIGGTFKAQLTDSSGTDVTSDATVYYGVFGAAAD